MVNYLLFVTCDELKNNQPLIENFTSSIASVIECFRLLPNHSDRLGRTGGNSTGKTSGRSAALFFISFVLLVPFAQRDLCPLLVFGNKRGRLEKKNYNTTCIMTVASPENEARRGTPLIISHRRLPLESLPSLVRLLGAVPLLFFSEWTHT